MNLFCVSSLRCTSMRVRKPLSATFTSCVMNHCGNCQPLIPVGGAVGSSRSGGGVRSWIDGTSSRSRNFSVRRGSYTSSPPGVQYSSPATRTECLGRSIMAPGPKVEITWLCRTWPCGLRDLLALLITILFNVDTIQCFQPDIDLRFDVAHRTIRPEFLIALRQRLQRRIQKLVQQPLRAPGFHLILKLPSDALQIVGNPAPFVEQIQRAVPNTAFDCFSLLRRETLVVRSG